MEYIIKATDRVIVLPKRGYYKLGDHGEDISIISSFLAFNFLGFERKLNVKVDNMLGDYFGNNLLAWIKEFQRINDLVTDGNIGPVTLQKLRDYGLDA